MKEKIRKINLFIITLSLIGIITIFSSVKVYANEYASNLPYHSYPRFESGDVIKCVNTSCKLYIYDYTKNDSSSTINLNNDETYTIPKTKNREYRVTYSNGSYSSAVNMYIEVYYITTPEGPEEEEEEEETPEEPTTTTKVDDPTTTTTKAPETTKKIEKVEEPVPTGLIDYIWIIPIVLVVGYFAVTKINKNKKFNNEL